MKKGQRIRIGGVHLLTVQEILAPNQVKVTFDGREILVTDLERAKLMDDVFVSCGLSMQKFGGPAAQYSRLAFEAPRAVRIERLQ